MWSLFRRAPALAFRSSTAVTCPLRTIAPRAITFAAATLHHRPLSSAVAPAASSSSDGSLSYFGHLKNEIGPLALNQIRDNVGARKKKKRVGRGVGSGRGRHCGRGMKGKRARAGNHGMLRRDGGQARLQKILPKVGHYRPRRSYAYLNLHRLQEAVQRGRLPVPPDRPIDVKDLFDAKLITLRQKQQGVKLLGRGADDFNQRLNVEVQLASQRSIDAIEQAGGKIRSVYYNRLTLRAKLKPQKFERAAVGRRGGDMRPRPALPPPQLMRDVYLSERHRGYLRDYEVGEVVRPHEHPEHVDLNARMKPRYPGWAAADQQAMAEGKPFIKPDGYVSTAEEQRKAQERSPYMSEIQKENPITNMSRPRGPYVPALPPKPRPPPKDE